MRAKSWKVASAASSSPNMIGRREAHERAVGPSVAGSIEEHPEDLVMAPGDHASSGVVPEVDERSLVALCDDEALRFTDRADPRIGEEVDRDDLRIDHVPSAAGQAMLGRVDRRGLAGFAIARLSFVVADVEVRRRAGVGSDEVAGDVVRDLQVLERLLVERLAPVQRQPSSWFGKATKSSRSGITSSVPMYQ